MADNTLIYDIIVGKNELNPAIGQANKAAFELGKQFQTTGQNIDQSFKSGQAAANVFDARLLSVLFSGMALSRAFGGINRSIVNTFMKAEDTTSGLGQATVRLAASWEFLKFSMFDALNNDFFIGMIDGIVGLINWFTQLPDEVKSSILIITTALAALGTGAMIYAQISLAWGAIFGVGGLLATKSLETAAAVTSVDTALVGVKTTAGGITFVGLLGTLAAVTAAAWLLYRAFEGINEITAQFTETEAPKAEDSYLAGADNLDVLEGSLSNLNVEWSNMRAGLDRTIGLQTTFNTTTGEFNQHIITTQDELQGVSAWAENWLNDNSLLNDQLSTNLIPNVQSYSEELNNIPREITTVLRVVREGGGSGIDEINQSSVST